MTKSRKHEFEGPFSVGDKLVTTKSVNGPMNTGQICFVVECTPKYVVVRFDTGPLSGDTIKVPYHAVELVMTAQKIARKAADRAARDNQ